MSDKIQGGQRRDVATAVLEMMRERYEMSERVFYHHKKAAASSMLAKLLELTPKDRRPRDDESIYPAPWQDTDQEWNANGPPHMAHLSDSQLIQYLAGQECEEANKTLQSRIARSLMYRRNGRHSGMYRTLLVVDQDLIRASKFALSAFTEDLRGKDRPSSVGRIRLENLLAEAASESPGQVIIYCPSEKMQAKEIDVRLEVKVESVLPLRELAAMGEFVDLADVEALRRHYEQLWRVYVFVSPEVFEDTTKCRAIVDRFCEEYAISRGDAYKKVRTHQFTYFQERGASLPASRTTEADSAPPASTGTNAAGLVLNGLGWDDKLLESRLNLANFVKKKKLSLSRRQVLWDGYQREYLGGDNSLIERTRRGAQSEKDWAERNQQLEREEREPELIKDE